MTRRKLLLLLLIVVASASPALALSGCGGAAPRAKLDALHKQLAPPAPAPLVHVRGPANTPLGVVLHLWRYQQVNNYPASLGLYDPRLVAKFGAATFMSALALERNEVPFWQLSMHSVESTPAGTMVVMHVAVGGASSANFSFLLRRRSGRWLITYDTLLESLVGLAVQGATQAKIDPAAARPDARAIRAGQSAIDAFRAFAAAKVAPVPTTTSTTPATVAPLPTTTSATPAATTTTVP